ncbi:hypothetical protein AAZX31_10G162800 [Glycine max]
MPLSQPSFHLKGSRVPLSLRFATPMSSRISTTTISATAQASQHPHQATPINHHHQQIYIDVEEREKKVRLGVQRLERQSKGLNTCERSIGKWTNLFAQS